ncbi:MAG: type IV pilus modification protein PilV [Pseudomonadales bacterium]|nr:type IV pilus modification protein PilV [Pseudomonadales bacterium]NRA18210.1 type IV pilus modification protein PilV [Oceanospirillaceae bacterium]
MIIPHRGQSLIEVMVVLLLISISLTGMVGTMITSQQLSLISIQTSDAVQLASNISERMRLNKPELQRMESVYLTAINPLQTNSQLCLDDQNCPQRLQALQDLNSWHLELVQKLPMYKAVICRDSTPGDGSYLKRDGCDRQKNSPVVIKLWWLSVARADNAQQFYALVHAQ